MTEMTEENRPWSISGWDITCTRWRNPEARSRRTAILLVHGMDSSRDIWRVIGPDHAAMLDTDVVAIDLPGFGDSHTVHRV